MPLVSFSPIVVQVEPQFQCWIGVIRVSISPLFPILRGNINSFTTEYYFNCSFSIDAYYQVEKGPLYPQFVNSSLSRTDVEYCQIIFPFLLTWPCSFVRYSTNMIYYIKWCSDDKPILNFQNKSCLVMVYNLFYTLLNLVC